MVVAELKERANPNVEALSGFYGIVFSNDFLGNSSDSDKPRFRQ